MITDNEIVERCQLAFTSGRKENIPEFLKRIHKLAVDRFYESDTKFATDLGKTLFYSVRTMTSVVELGFDDWFSPSLDEFDDLVEWLWETRPPSRALMTFAAAYVVFVADTCPLDPGIFPFSPFTLAIEKVRKIAERGPPAPREIIFDVISSPKDAKRVQLMRQEQLMEAQRREVLKLLENFRSTEAGLATLTNSLGDRYQEAIKKMDIAGVEFRKTLAASAVEASEARKKISAEGSDFQALIDQYRMRGAEVEQNAVALSNRIDEHKKELAAIEQRQALLSIETLWNEIAHKNRSAFIASATVLITLLFVVPFIALYNLDWVLGKISHIGEVAAGSIKTNDTATQTTLATISRFVVISTPLAFYVWMTRLVVRFNSLCYVVMQDARQRHTTMEVYFHIVKTLGAVETERALMLNAIFRPPPGQGSDNIEPPNFADLIGKTVGGDKS